MDDEGSSIFKCNWKHFIGTEKLLFLDCISPPLNVFKGLKP